MSNKHKGEKYCPACKSWKSEGEFHSEGQGRGTKKNCGVCVNLHRKDLKAQKVGRKDALVTALLQLGRHDLERLNNIDEYEFLKKTNSFDHIDEFGYDNIRKLAINHLYQSGHHRPKSIDLPSGRYMIVSDSHGKHTRTKMFDLIKNVNKFLNIDNVIHLGHILDDDNDMSYHWGSIENLIVVTKAEEAKTIEQIIKREKYDFQIVREEISIGDFKVLNQDLIQDYVKTFVGSLDQEIFPDSIVVNGHRHEMDTRCTYQGNVFAMCPGSLCEKHIVKTIKQIDFTSGYQVKQARPDGFIKYRRMKHLFEFWQQGLIILEVGDDGKCFAYPSRIKEIEDEYVTSYYDNIITSDDVHDPDVKILLNSDNHVPSHDARVFDILDQFAKDYEPDIHVNAGDFVNGEALNHHAMDRGHPILGMTLMEEFSQANYILRKMSEWAPKNYILHGNHERFLSDFTDKFPQLKSILNFRMLADLEGCGYEVVDLKGVLELGDLKVVHGDIRMYGAKGNVLEKVSRTFGSNTIMGHIHKPSMRFNCYSMGFTGLMDQGYNEVHASAWIHGFAICNQYKGHSFITPININNLRLLFHEKEYSSDNDQFWKDCKSFKVKISYDFD